MAQLKPTETHAEEERTFQNEVSDYGSVIRPTLWHSPSHAFYWHKTKYAMLKTLRKIVSKMDKREPIRILDLGCAGGTDVFMYARLLPPELKIEFTGLDVSDKNVDTARERAQQLGFKNTTFIVGDAVTLEQVEGTFDIITSSEVIEHVPDPGAMVRSISEHLAPGGHVILSTPTVTRSSALFYKYLFRRLERKTAEFDTLMWSTVTSKGVSSGHGHISEMKARKLVGLMQDAGLSLKSIRRGSFSYGGYGWDRHRWLFNAVALIDVALDGYYAIASRIPILRNQTFSVNGVFHARKRS
jgi:2-polyprenyl-3-methyl-5-hydroxy-6-metoxy-1,4-benzoquinol methylase